MTIRGRPRLPKPRDLYEISYMNSLVRAIEDFMRLSTDDGDSRFSSVVLTDLQDDDVGLEAGTVYKVGNVLYVSVSNIAAVRGASLTMASGTVIISIA